MENISYHVVAGNIGKELLHKIICALLEGTEEDESLKLRYIMPSKMMRDNYGS